MRTCGRLIILALAVWAGSGCASGQRIGTGALGAALPMAPAPVDTKEVDQQIAVARRDLSQALEHLHNLVNERDELATDAAKTRLGWTAGLLLAASIAFGVLAFVLPVGARWSVLASIGAFVGAALALFLRMVYAWLTVGGAVLAVAFVAYAIWQIVKHKRATAEAADHGTRLESAIKMVMPGPIVNSLITDVKMASAAAQDKAGVRKLISAVRWHDLAV